MTPPRPRAVPSAPTPAMAWVDGVVGPAADAAVPVTDPGFLVGHGVFETTTVVRGVPFAASRHLRRLRRSAAIARVEVPWSDAELRGACEAAIGAFAAAGGPGPGTFGRLRMTATAGGTLAVVVAEAPDWPATTTLAIVDAPINERSPVAGAKTVSQLDEAWCRQEAARRGAGEAVRANTAGVLCEGASTNVFLVLDGRLVTPSLATGCLPGVTRSLIVDLVEVDERDDLDPRDLWRAEEVFVTSSTRGVHPVTAVDRRPVPAPGPRTEHAKAALATLTAASSDP